MLRLTVTQMLGDVEPSPCSSGNCYEPSYGWGMTYMDTESYTFDIFCILIIPAFEPMFYP